MLPELLDVCIRQNNTDYHSECHGAYGSQTHIEGEEPTSGTDFYGIGITSSAQCKVEFEC